jgi:hypothetical protein
MIMPVELRGGDERWFRLSETVDPRSLLLGQAAPDELDGVIAIAFHLPGDQQPISCHARIGEVVLEDRAERRELIFLDLDDNQRARIEAYVTTEMT